MKQKQWYTVNDVEKLSAVEKIVLTKKYVNPGMVKIFELLGFDKLWACSAEGMYLNLSDGRRILDMTAGSCVLGLGHNNQRILSVRARVANENRLEICKAFISPYVAALAANMADILPGDLQYSFFCGSGAEAVEGALKLAEKHHGRDRLGVIYTDRSFHGKTHAAMSVSSLDNSRKYFKLLEHCYQVPYGDADALERLFISRCQNKSQRPDLCAFIVEAIHGSRILFPPHGYLQKVRGICTKYDVLLILDEIYTGFGRTGYWFAFERESIVPDIVCYSKAFGGGKATIAGYTTRESVFLRAYGSSADSMIHSSTFSGMSEECASAIEALNIIRDDGLVHKARELGEYLGNELYKLKSRYPGYINDIRGCGLLWGIELKPLFEELEHFVLKILPDKTSLLSVLSGAIVLSELFHSHNVLAYLGLTRRNLIVFSPPLIINKPELDNAIAALDAVLSSGWPKLIRSFIVRQLDKSKF